MRIISLSFQFASKQMARSAKKCEKDEKTEKLKLKKVCNNDFELATFPLLIIISYVSAQALQKGNVEGARIHAENAIRQKNQVLPVCCVAR